jgi:hypothetical protein
MKVLISIEPRAYRDAIGGALQDLRPHLEVAIVEPEALQEEILRFGPELVFASQPETLTLTGKHGWVEFRPYEETPTKIRIGGRLRVLRQLDLPNLLSTVDEAEELSQLTTDFPNSSTL